MPQQTPTSRSSASRARALPTAKAVKSSTEWFLLHVRMDEIEPPVWRQMIVPSKLTLDNLHPLLVAAFDLQPRSRRGFKVTKVKRCQLAGQGTLVTSWNRSGYTVPKYTLDNPVHQMFKDRFDLQDERETTSYRVSGMARAFMEMSRTSVPRRPKYTLEKTTNIGKLNEQYKLSRNKHVLVYDRGDMWEYLIRIEGIRGAEKVMAAGVGDSWILGGTGHYEDDGEDRGGGWFSFMDIAARQGQGGLQGVLSQRGVEEANERFVELLANPTEDEDH